ncbi:hypothetical protein CWI36_0729p0010 [Hamiltosporidium magnivora]|uniref:Uncharacterized protein n=1 Tax=Hamiltosporidium magnivora TaxID=148818 RepID=A0A4Q9LC72_9MICR|nr:hypothetical protein CWI36_0729p0010 [Hamiltosporidium magnivora]
MKCDPVVIVNKSESDIQKCELHPPANSLPSSSYTTTTHLPPSQTCSNMQNNGLFTLPSPNTPLPSSVEVLLLKKLAQSEMGKERRRIATCLADTSTLTETTEYINLRDKFLSKIKEISGKEIGKVVVELEKIQMNWLIVKFWISLIE